MKHPTPAVEAAAAHIFHTSPIRYLECDQFEFGLSQLTCTPLYTKKLERDAVECYMAELDKETLDNLVIEAYLEARNAFLVCSLNQITDYLISDQDFRVSVTRAVQARLLCD
jgi:hypothetical protein